MLEAFAAVHLEKSIEEMSVVKSEKNSIWKMEKKNNWN